MSFWFSIESRNEGIIIIELFFIFYSVRFFVRGYLLSILCVEVIYSYFVFFWIVKLW